MQSNQVELTLETQDHPAPLTQDPETANQASDLPFETQDPVAQEAAELRYLRAQFLASLNHQIRTPMSGILGMIDLLMETQLDAEQKEYVTATRICAQELFDLLSASLEFSSLTSGSPQLKETEFDLVEVLETSLTSHALQAESKGLELACNISTTLPSLVCGDELRLRQLLAQLLANAVKFTEHGYVELAAESVEVAPDRFLLEVAVRDTGIGIPPEQRAMIFESFHRANGADSRYSGLGVGLAIAKKVINLMGGEIGVASEPGKGSVFSFSVPLAISSEVVNESWDRSLEGRNIMVLHANLVVARRTSQLLKQFRIQPLLAYSIDEAQRVLERDPNVWAVILDGEAFPQQTTAFCGHVKNVAPGAFLIGTVSPSKTERLTPVGVFDAELAKPLRRYPLYDTLLGLLGRTAKTAHRARHILVAEDNLISQRLVTHILRRGGYEVDAVATGRAALEAVESRSGAAYDLILMDLQMPGMNGLEATDHIRRLPQGDSIPIVALTADTSEETRAECRRRGMDGYLVKPVKSEALLSSISRFLT